MQCILVCVCVVLCSHKCVECVCTVGGGIILGQMQGLVVLATDMLVVVHMQCLTTCWRSMRTVVQASQLADAIMYCALLLVCVVRHSVLEAILSAAERQLSAVCGFGWFAIVCVLWCAWWFDR